MLLTVRVHLLKLEDLEGAEGEAVAGLYVIALLYWAVQPQGRCRVSQLLHIHCRGPAVPGRKFEV